MTADAVMMDQHENVRGAFTRSLVLHLSIAGTLLLYSWLQGLTEQFGDENAGGALVGIEMVDPIPLPSRGPENPVANDSESIVPQEVTKPAPKAAPEPEPEDALPLLPPDRKSKQPLVPKNRLTPFNEIEKNQLTSKSEQAVSSPLFSAPSGAGQINTGENTALGTRFAAYAATIKQLTTSNWRRQDIDRSVNVAPLVTISFDILRNGGKAAKVRLSKRSNIPSLDLSVQNAVEDTNYPPLPPGYEGNSVTITYTFELKR